MVRDGERILMERDGEGCGTQILMERDGEGW